MLRTVTYLCIASVVGVIAATTLTCGVGLASGTSTWCSSVFSVFGIPIGIVCGVVAGLPAYLVFKKLGWSRWWQFVLAGIIVAIPAWFVLTSPFGSVRWQSAGLFETLQYLGAGAFAGLAAYFLLHTERPAEAPDHRESAL